MFLEYSNHPDEKRGWIEVITGCMFAGKTEELIRRLKRAKFAHQKVAVFKPAMEKRFSREKVTSHNATTMPSISVKRSVEILSLVNDIEVVCIDEAQFFEADLVDICNKLANNGLRIIVAGLDLDFRGNPFGPMPGLMASAEYVTKLHAICVRCGNLAQYSYRTAQDDHLVLLGSGETYEPLCRKCYFTAMNEIEK